MHSSPILHFKREPLEISAELYLQGLMSPKQ